MTHPTMQRVVIHCKPSILSNQNVKNGSLYWEYSKQFKDEEIDVFVNYIDDSLLTNTHDPDVILCDYYNLDYDQVNCIEAVWVIRSSER